MRHKLCPVCEKKIIIQAEICQYCNANLPKHEVTLPESVVQESAYDKLSRDILCTTGFNFEGYAITRYFGYVSAKVVLGTGFISDFGAAIADLFGARSPAYEEKLDLAEKHALAEMMEKAKNMQANAIIGIDVDIITFSRDVIGIVASGTAVIAAQEQSRSVPPAP